MEVSCGAEEHRSDEVISCADGHATLFDMLDGKYVSPQQRSACETYPEFSSLIYVGGLVVDSLDAELGSTLPGAPARALCRKYRKRFTTSQ